MEHQLLYFKSELIRRYFASMSLLVMSFIRGFFFGKLLRNVRLYFRPSTLILENVNLLW